MNFTHHNCCSVLLAFLFSSDQPIIYIHHKHAQSSQQMSNAYCSSAHLVHARFARWRAVLRNEPAFRRREKCHTWACAFASRKGGFRRTQQGHALEAKVSSNPVTSSRSRIDLLGLADVCPPGAPPLSSRNRFSISLKSDSPCPSPACLTPDI